MVLDKNEKGFSVRIILVLLGVTMAKYMCLSRLELGFNFCISLQAHVIRVFPV